jgi:hypothetical protein
MSSTAEASISSGKCSNDNPATLAQRILLLAVDSEDLYFILRDLLNRSNEYARAWEAIEKFLALAGKLDDTIDGSPDYGQHLTEFSKYGNLLFSKDLSSLLSFI